MDEQAALREWEKRAIEKLRARVADITSRPIEDLVQRMIADGRPIEEQCTVEILPPYINTADHKDTTEPHE